MSKRLQGHVLFGEYKSTNTFQWTDETGAPIPLTSWRVLIPWGDGTVTRENISVPQDYNGPELKEGEIYGFPVTVRLNKKKQRVSWSARTDMQPFPAPTIG